MVKNTNKDNKNSKKLKKKATEEDSDVVETIDPDADHDIDIEDLEDIDIGEDEELPEDVKEALGLTDDEKKKTKPVVGKAKEDYISEHEMQFLKAMEEPTFDSDDF